MHSQRGSKKRFSYQVLLEKKSECPVIDLVNNQDRDDYENEVEIINTNIQEEHRGYNLFRVLLYYIIIGFLGWNIFYFLFTSPLFDITKISVYGTNYLQDTIILNQSELNEPVNIFHFDLEKACKKLAQNPWIKDITMKKIYPNHLEIGIIEQKPGTFLYHNNNYYLVTAEGVILEILNQFNNNLSKYIITGLNVNSKRPGQVIEDQEYKEVQRIIFALDHLFPDQFYKIEVISEEEFLLFHINNRIKVRLESGEQLINKWYLLESALQKINTEEVPLQEINMKYQERLLIVLPE